MKKLKDRAELWVRIEEHMKASGDLFQPKIDDKGKAPMNPQQNNISNRKRPNNRGKESGNRRTFTTYTPLLTYQSKVYKKVMHTEITGRPPTMRGQLLDKKKFCKYHRDYDHKTNECIQLRGAIERLIQEGKLREFV
jgi:hypothetical protein